MPLETQIANPPTTNDGADVPPISARHRVGRGEDRAGQRPICWVLTDGKVGMEVQCLGLAQTLGLAPVVKRIRNRLPWRWLPPRLAIGALHAPGPAGDRLCPPWPDLLIASGRQSVAVAAAIRRASAGRTFTVQIQDPKLSPSAFDMVVVPDHDRLRGEGVVTTHGSMNGITESVLAEAATHWADSVADLPAPRVAVLLGGPNKTYAYTDGFAESLGQGLRSMATTDGVALLVTPSRRTPPHFVAAIQAHIRDLPHRVWNGSGANPYHGYLGLAAAIVVTADSVNMVTEACTSGRPVLVAEPPGGGGKFGQFHDSMRSAGFTRPFQGRLEKWAFDPPRETQRVAALIADALIARGFDLSTPPAA